MISINITGHESYKRIEADDSHYHVTYSTGEVFDFIKDSCENCGFYPYIIQLERKAKLSKLLQK